MLRNIKNNPREFEDNWKLLLTKVSEIQEARARLKLVGGVTALPYSSPDCGALHGIIGACALDKRFNDKNLYLAVNEYGVLYPEYRSRKASKSFTVGGFVAVQLLFGLGTGIENAFKEMFPLAVVTYGDMLPELHVYLFTGEYYLDPANYVHNGELFHRIETVCAYIQKRIEETTTPS